MLIRFFISLLFVSLLACGGSATKNEVSAQPAPAVDHFQDMQGCFLLYNMKTNQFEKVIGEENCKTAYPASSTFKPPIAVMAFDSGALKDENQVLKWDGKKGDREELNRDHNAKTWMRDSIVWFSQRLTVKMGLRKVQKYLDAFDYGNKDMKGGIKQAWLVSAGSSGPALKITGYQQIEWMKKLWTNALPVSLRAQKLTQEIMFLETSPSGFEFSGKTGSNFFDPERRHHLGWFISHLKKGEQEYLTVANFRDLKPYAGPGFGGPRAKAITKAILAEQGLW